METNERLGIYREFLEFRRKEAIRDMIIGFTMLVIIGSLILTFWFRPEWFIPEQYVSNWNDWTDGIKQNPIYALFFYINFLFVWFAAMTGSRSRYERSKQMIELIDTLLR